MSVILTEGKKQECLKDIASTISFTPYMNNQPVVASAATLTVRKPGGEILVAAGTSTTISAAGLIYYSLTAGNTAELGENYKAEFVYTVSGTTYYYTLLFDVVRTKLSIPIVDADLIQEQSDILSKNENFGGVVDSASSTTIVDDELKSYADDYWNGGTCEVTLSSSSGKQVRNITDFVQSTGTVTVGVAFGTTPTSSYRYILRRGFQRKIERAFDEVCFDIFSRGNRCALILESSEIKVPMIKKALAIICADYMKEPNDKWDLLYQRYSQEYKDLMLKLRLQYDKDEDGLITGSEANKDFGQVRMRI